MLMESMNALVLLSTMMMRTRTSSNVHHVHQYNIVSSLLLAYDASDRSVYEFQSDTLPFATHLHIFGFLQYHPQKESPMVEMFHIEERVQQVVVLL